MYTCDRCTVHACDNGDMGKAPANCPCLQPELTEKIKTRYLDETNRKLAYHSARVEAEGYCQKTRLEEIMDFARRCEFNKLGVAFCIGSEKEARLLGKVLRHNGFEVHSVVCKCGNVPKEFIGIKDGEKLEPGTHEAMCNPIGQAELLNRSGTDFNIMLGLCVGHDSLFMRASEAPATVFVAKDRVLGHNPVAALYLSEGYYKSKLYK